MSKIIIAEHTHKWVDRCDELNKQNSLLKKENKHLKKLLSKLFTTADISYCDDNFLQEIMNTLYKKGDKK